MKAAPVLVALVLAAGHAFAGCDPTGEFKGDRARSQSISVKRTGEVFEVWMDTSGTRMADGNRTTGALRGTLHMSEHRCVGAYLAPEEECSLFLVFRPSGVDVHQFGSCMFGAGAWAGGTYKRVSDRRSTPQRDVAR